MRKVPVLFYKDLDDFDDIKLHDYGCSNGGRRPSAKAIYIASTSLKPYLLIAHTNDEIGKFEPLPAISGGQAKLVVVTSAWVYHSEEDDRAYTDNKLLCKHVCVDEHIPFHGFAYNEFGFYEALIDI